MTLSIIAHTHVDIGELCVLAYNVHKIFIIEFINQEAPVNVDSLSPEQIVQILFPSGGILFVLKIFTLMFMGYSA